jgi:O-antigen/teichoic acid export membrane protein
MMLTKSLILIFTQRLWQALGGALTIIFIAHTLSPNQQGWFYTFMSISSLYTLFEMGLSMVLVQVAANMFVKLGWLPDGGLIGRNKEVFISFFSSAMKLYIRVALLFFGFAFMVGYFIFTQKSGYIIEKRSWLWPWITLLIGTAANMMTLPFFAVVEGSGDVAEVYAIRLLQGILGSFLCWIVLFSEGDLWAVSMMPISSVVVSLLWLYKKRPQLLNVILSKSPSKKFNWSQEVWPFQWRIGLNLISLFAMSQLCVPILFYYQNSTVAGQMGLSLSIVHMLGIFSQSWITRHITHMSHAAAKKNWLILDDIFKKAFLRSVITFFVGGLIALILLKFTTQSSYANRIFGFWQFIGLLIFSFFYYINIALAMQLRSFRKEPLVWITFFGGIFISIATLITAKNYSIDGVILAIVLIQAFLISPLSFYLWKVRNIEYRLNN